MIGFVTNGGYIDTNSADGLRKCLADEFSSLYFFHLRGNQRTSGERSRQEGGKIFGGGSRAPIVIAVLVKNPKVKQYGQIYFHDIGDYLSREDKLEKISDLVSINGITAIDGWTKITPDEHNDWLNQRDDSFSGFIEIGNKKDKSKISLFLNYSRGAESGRDAWVYQSSNEKLKHNIESMINFYNNNLTNGNNPIMDTTKISWTSSLLSSFEKKNNITFDESLIRFSIYRPYQKQNLYFGGGLIHRVGQMPQIFPTSDTENLILYISGSSSSGKDFSVIITNIIPDLNMQHSGGQGFPLYLYEETTVKGNGADLFNHAQTKTADGKYIRKDAISDEGLKHFQDAYPTETISKEDIFYYVYGLLHSEDYRSRYADNLTKELPRIPCVKKTEDFWAFSKAGRDLAHWHLNYETVEPYKAKLDLGGKSLKQLADKDFYVTKMKFPKKDQKDTVVYNNAITIREIPIEAYDYVVNGKSALEWVMERQGVSTHKDSGIVNDANNWAIETMGDAKYPLNLFLRVIKVSLETMKIVKALPKLDI